MSQLTFLYPSAVEDATLISFGAQCAKVARHSHCSSCDCIGLHPTPEWKAVPDDTDTDEVNEVFEAIGIDNTLTDEGFLAYCACEHPLEDHGCGRHDTTDPAEFANRASVAGRIDAHL